MKLNHEVDLLKQIQEDWYLGLIDEEVLEDLLYFYGEGRFGFVREALEPREWTMNQVQEVVEAGEYNSTEEVIEILEERGHEVNKNE